MCPVTGIQDPFFDGNVPGKLSLDPEPAVFVSLLLDPEQGLEVFGVGVFLPATVRFTDRPEQPFELIVFVCHVHSSEIKNYQMTDQSVFRQFPELLPCSFKQEEFIQSSSSETP